MGYCPAEPLTNGARLVLDALKESERVAYSYFYDGTDARDQFLMVELGLEDDFYGVASLIDFSVTQLEEAGLVTTRDLDTTLADGEPDYEIRLTPQGKQLLASGATFTCHDLHT